MIIISACLQAVFFVYSARPASAADAISRRFLGSYGSGVIASGVHRMSASGSQTAAGRITSGSHAIQSGFYSFASQGSGSLTADPGQRTVLSVLSDAGPITLGLPPGALPLGTVLTLRLPATVPAIAGAALEALSPPLAVEILSPFSPLLPVELSFSYAGGNLNARNPEHFVVARFDERALTWVPMVSSVDSAKLTVTGLLRHFSIFQVMVSIPSDSLDKLRVAPNPLLPARGHTAMGFFNLPASSARLRIYNLSGEFVRELASDAAGLAVWDGSNQNGSKAASGVYFVFVESAGRSRTLKVVLQR